MTTYSTRILRNIDNGPGRWNYLEVGIFRLSGENEEQIGSYTRNYSNFYSTFYPFQKNGKDYALYSPDYTGTRILALPSCEDIGGEERAGGGFCPTDFFVPCYIEREYVDLKDVVHRHRLNEPRPTDLIATTTKYAPLDEKTGQRIVVEKPSYPVTDILYYPFGFVAGCIWGDDSSWKIQYLDLSQVEKGIIKREERFGYIALPDHLSLKQAVKMHDYATDPTEDWSKYITIAVQKQFDLTTGKIVERDPFD